MSVINSKKMTASNEVKSNETQKKINALRASMKAVVANKRLIRQQQTTAIDIVI